MVIYKITNLINGMSYIGQTIQDLKIRFKQHRRTKSGCQVLARAIAKYGRSNFKIDILESGFSSKEQLDAREIYYIKLYNSQVPNGYNVTCGGQGTSGYKMPLEVKLAIKMSQKQQYATRTGKAIDFGRTLPKRIKCSNGKEYTSIREASLDLNIDRSHIRRTLKGAIKAIRGYSFTYLESV